MGATGHTYLRVDAFDYVSTFTIKMFYVEIVPMVKNDCWRGHLSSPHSQQLLAWLLTKNFFFV